MSCVKKTLEQEIKSRHNVDKSQVNEVQKKNNKYEENNITYLSLKFIESEKYRNWTDTSVVIDDK